LPTYAVDFIYIDYEGLTMENIADYISTHQFTVGVCVFVAILIIYFLFKKLIKLALLFILGLLVFTGYVYFKDPQKMPKNIGETMQKAKEETGSVVEKGRGVYDSLKGIYKKGEKLVTKDFDKSPEPDKKPPKEK
jgi:hypothetical protein